MKSNYKDCIVGVCKAAKSRIESVSCQRGKRSQSRNLGLMFCVVFVSSFAQVFVFQKPLINFQAVLFAISKADLLAESQHCGITFPKALFGVASSFSTALFVYVVSLIVVLKLRLI
ncbi:hypothetical protein ACFSJQ_09845 [Vibrio olivae]|uniref:CASP-like protein n=1 Tax=Vibrio olivae TaxID=1243002 RepID=A0ABV5HH96_9VIBR